VFAAVPPEATREATWNVVDGFLRTWTPDVVDAGSLLVVPTVRLDLAARFASLEGGPLEGVPDIRLERFEERIRFARSERGASLTGESVVLHRVGLHPELVFDRPFLLALRRVGAPKPDLLRWIGNDALLERWSPPKIESANAATKAVLAARWTLDPEATFRACILRERDLGMFVSDDLGFARPDGTRGPAGQRR